MNVLSRTFKRSVFAVSFTLLASTLAVHGSTVTVSPANPTILVGQTTQLGTTGAVFPTAISSGLFHTCVLYSDQTIRCTGANNQGEIGNNSYIAVSEPALAIGTMTPSVLRVGSEHTCSFVGDGRLQCWGTNYTGQLGEGSFGGFEMTPIFVHNISSAAKLIAGGWHTCAVLTDRTMQCWGRNQDGQVGNGDYINDVSLPTPVTGLAGPVIDAFGGGYHTCALMPDTTLQCWGRNARGQVGDGTVNTPIVQPHTVAGLSGVVTARGGGYHTCALLQNATVDCWGQSDFGQIGAPGAFSASPVQVPLSNVTQIAAGFWSSCAVTSDGLMHCWGRNDYGGLGDGTTASTSAPVTVQGISNPTAIAVGWGHSCALMPDASVKCWGENEYGQLGNGTTTASSTPVTMHFTGLTWTSSDPGVATVSATGVVTGVARGTATITVSDAFGNSGSTTVTVKQMLTLGVLPQGDGGGTVTSAPAGVNCGTTCAAQFLSDSQVTLTAVPRADSTFTGWTGCDSVSAATCVVTMANARSVTAIFMLKRFTLSVTKTGIGKGTVTSSPVGINCGTACASDFVINTTVTLTATPQMLSIFNGWTGCDAVNSNTCTVHITANKNVSADFLGVPFP
jgi:hypothetical protein